MRKTTPMLLLVSVLLVLTQACAPPGTATPDPNSVSTAIAQTVTALTQTFEPGIPVTGDETPTATQVFTPSPELPSPTPSVTPSAIIVFTATPATPQIYVSVPTNCRVGPGTVYQRVGALLVGEVAEVVGRHATRDYWVIRNPDRPGELCWLWGEYATVTGNAGSLPEYEPPPTPTPSPTATPAPSFTAAYSGIESCAGIGWWVDIQLTNPAGGIPFQSISMTVRDTTTNAVLSLYSDDFTDRSGCVETNTRDTLPSGENRMVSSPVFVEDPSGRALLATITLCSNPGQNGLCVTRTINFTP